MGILRSDRVSGLGGANAINGSVKFTGNDDFLRTEDLDDFYLDGNFTIEFWIKPNQKTSNYCLFTEGNNEKITFSASNTYLIMENDGSSLNIRTANGTVDWDVNSWHHVAFVRSGTTSSDIACYLNGVSLTLTSPANSGSAVWDGGSMKIGEGNPGDFGGYLSNVRFTKGTALYTANFTPPTTRLEKRSDTVLLCCNDPGNVLAESTGKTLTINRNGVNSTGPVASRFAPDVGEDYGTTFADNTKFDTLSYMVPPGGTTAESNRGRGVLFGGQSPGADSTIQYVQIQSQGNAIKFGNLSDNKSAVGAVASSTRAVSAGGYIAANTNVIEYVTIATTSNATDFGDLAESKHWVQGGGNQTRGILAGGNANSPIGHTNTIEYITIATAGNASNFGDIARKPSTSSGSAMNSSTRAVFGGGSDPSAALYNTLEYVTIATTGDATDFGDMTDNKARYGGCSSSIRGIIGCGENPGISNVITYITIATTGNSVDFGDATQAREDVAAVSNSIRGVFVGGQTPTNVNTMDYINIATTGNAQDFGDQTILADHVSGCSDSHGGIS